MRKEVSSICQEQLKARVLLQANETQAASLCLPEDSGSYKKWSYSISSSNPFHHPLEWKILMVLCLSYGAQDRFVLAAS